MRHASGDCIGGFPSTLMQNETDMVEIDRQRYAVTHFKDEGKGGSFRALKLLGPARSLGTALLLPGDIPIEIHDSTNVSDYTECLFRFL